MFKKTSSRTCVAPPALSSDLPAFGALSARPAPAAALQASSRGPSTLSSDLRLDGTLSGAGDIQIDGQIKGDVRVGRLIVGETGSIEGNVAVDYLEVRGRVVGAVNGKQVRLTTTGYVEGDITAEQLSIDAGAYFQGRVLKTTPAPTTEA